MKFVILEKAFGKKNYARLVKKVITDKNGKRTTVWVLPAGADKVREAAVDFGRKPWESIEQKAERLKAARQKKKFKSAATANMERWKKEKAARKKVKAELLASGVNIRFRKEMLKQNKVDLIGQRIENPSDLASLAQIYRNPLYETFRIVLLDKNNIVKGLTGISCKLPGISMAYTMPVYEEQDKEKAFRDLKDRMARIGAVKYYLVHNHPSGDPHPSKMDQIVTNSYRNGVPGFGGHVIIDHKEFAMATGAGGEGGTVTVRHGGAVTIEESPIHPLPKPPEGPDPLHVPTKAHGALGRRIRGPDDIAGMIKEFQLKKEGYLCLIGVSSGAGGTSGIMEVPHEYFSPGNEKKGLATIVSFARMCGAGYVVAAETKTGQVGVFARAMQQGFLRDVITEDGKSFNEMGIESHEALEPIGTRVGVWEEGER